MIARYSTVLSLLLAVVAITLCFTKPVGMAAAQTTIGNFEQQIEQKISKEKINVDVIFESPKTVIIQGGDVKLTPGGTGVTSNDELWKAVDLLKIQGFGIDNIDLLKTGESTNTYQIVLSHP